MGGGGRGCEGELGVRKMMGRNTGLYFIAAGKERNSGEEEASSYPTLTTALKVLSSGTNPEVGGMG